MYFLKNNYIQKTGEKIHFTEVSMLAATQFTKIVVKDSIPVCTIQVYRFHFTVFTVYSPCYSVVFSTIIEKILSNLVN